MRLRGWLIGRPRLRSVLRLAMVAAALWLVLTEGRRFGPEVLLAIAAAVAAGLYYGPDVVHRWRPIELLKFLAHFVRSSLRGGVDVALRAMRPDLPVESVFIRRRIRVEHGQPRTLLVSSISLMPGTLTADVEGDEIELHLLDASMEGEVDELEARVDALFARGQEMGPLV